MKRLAMALLSLSLLTGCNIEVKEPKTISEVKIISVESDSCFRGNCIFKVTVEKDGSKMVLMSDSRYEKLLIKGETYTLNYDHVYEIVGISLPE